MGGHRVERRDRSDGSLIGEFGTDGVLTIPISPGYFDTVGARMEIIVDECCMYLMGPDESLGENDGQWHVEKRHKLTGAL